MFFFMSEGDFKRLYTVVDGIRTNSLKLDNADMSKLMQWVNNDQQQFDDFCVYIANMMDDMEVPTTDTERIAELIHNALRWQ